jgi:hypothetical protein
MSFFTKAWEEIKKILELPQMGKDAALSLLVKEIFIKPYIKEYSDMVDFSIDSKNKNISIQFLLKGEKEQIEAKIKKYNITSDDDGTYFKFTSIKTNREWLNIVIDNHIKEWLPKNRIEVPEGIASTITKIFL